MARTRETPPEYLVNDDAQLVWWEDLPIRVYFDFETMNEEQIVLARTAFQVWNSAIGEEVFDIDPPMVSHSFIENLENSETIFVKIDALRNRRGVQKLGYCKYSFRLNRFGDNISIHSTTIVLHDELEWEEIMFVTLHEAGHALGLMHDRDRQSIMFRTPLSGGMGFQEKDVEYIKSQIALMRMRQRGYREVYQ